MSSMFQVKSGRKLVPASATPGPWSVFFTDRADTPKIRARGCTVAEVIPQSHGISIANANLIAAAPDLLAALEDIVRAEWTTVSLQAATPQHRARLEAARAAITKAKA